MRVRKTLTGVASAAMGPYLRVHYVDGKLALAGATDNDVGTLELGVLDADLSAAYVPANVEGSVKMVASEPIDALAEVYAAAGGKIAASGTLSLGVAVTAASADNSILEVQRDKSAAVGTIARTGMGTDAAAPYDVPLRGMLVPDGSALLGAAAGTPAGALGITPGAHGTATPKLIGEAANANSKSDAARFFFALPVEYVAAAAVKLRVHARITGDVQVAQTIDAAVYAGDGEAGVSADLCATNAQNLTDAFADYDFTITAAALAAGDVLDVLITGAANDTGGTANKLIEIGKVEMLLNVRG